VTTSPPARIPSNAFYVLRLMRQRPIRYGIPALAWLLYHVLPLFPGLIGKAFFDVLQHRAAAGLTVESIAALALAVGLAKVGTIASGLYSTTWWRFHACSLLQRNLLARIFELPGADAVPSSVGESISTMRDDVEAIARMGDWSFDAVAGCVFAVGGIAILMAVDARVAALVVLPIAAVIAVAQAARVRLESVRQRSRAATARVTGAIGEVFGSVLAVQVAGAEDAVVGRLRRYGDERRRAMLNDELQGLAVNAVFANSASLGAGLTLLFASSEMRSGQFTVGDFVLFATYLMQVAEYTGFLGYLSTAYRQSVVAFRRAVALLRGARPQSLVAFHSVERSWPPPPAVVTPVSAPPLALLEVEDLSMRFPTSGRGISDVSFRVGRGQVVVVTGRIGSGKTTLLRTVLGLLEPAAGTVSWNGRTIESPATFLVPPRVAYTSQTPRLLSGTLRENVLLGLPDDGRLEEATAVAALGPDLAAFPRGLDTDVGVRGVRLSGGQVQRTAAARMLARRAELLVIDDLSSALDRETEQELWQGILRAGVTCLLTSHRRGVLEAADEILMMQDGRIIARGALRDLLRTSEEFRSLYEAELGLRDG
jgi:ATP-binding cassette, subfamily B, bacterial